MSPTTPSPDGAKPKGGIVPSEGTVLKILTGVQYTSGLIFSVFVGAHLLAPIAAAIGGGSAADKTMLLTREYYHAFENFAVWVPLGLHLVSGSAKRALLTAKTRRLPLINVFTVSGWALAVIVPIHALVHRIIPSWPDPPISSLSPSELGFDFIGYTMRYRTLGSILAYLGLAGLIVPHAWIGLGKALPWARRTLGLPRSTSGNMLESKTGKQAMWTVVAGLLSVVAVMMARMYREGELLSPSLLRRYEAVHQMTPWEQMGLVF